MRPYTNANQSQMFCKTWDTPALMLLDGDKDMLMPGEDSNIRFLLKKTMVSGRSLCVLISCLYSVKKTMVRRAGPLGAVCVVMLCLYSVAVSHLV